MSGGVAEIPDIKVSDRSHLKISTPKQMPQRITISLAQLKVVIHLKTY